VTFAQGRERLESRQADASRVTERDDALLHTIVDAADAAASFIRERSASLGSLEWRAKSASDFVSDVDTGAESIITRALSSLPDGWDQATTSRILAEESSPDRSLGTSGIAYVVDPLDGTTNFLHGFPWYAVSIAALVDGALAAGVVHNVPSGDVFSAVARRGATRNGEPIHVSRIDEPARALLGTGLPFKYHEQIAPYLRALPEIMRSTAGIRRAGSASLDLCDVACGRFDAFWELSLAPWDMAAGMLIVREAGGLVTNLDGDDAQVGNGPIVAGNPALHAWLLRVLDSSVKGD
jgi:myo-inositol-1(or 4)-monophosphatase